jgi:hypothetical protein
LYIPIGLREPLFLGGLQSEPDTRIAHASYADANLLINMRKGEPKVDQMDWLVNIQGENARGPELPHATCLPGGSLPAGATLPLSFPVRLRGPIQRIWRGPLDQSKVQDRVTGWETQMWLRCRGLGKSVPGKLAFVGGKPPLTAKSLSANTV